MDGGGGLRSGISGGGGGGGAEWVKRCIFALLEAN